MKSNQQKGKETLSISKIVWKQIPSVERKRIRKSFRVIHEKPEEYIEDPIVEHRCAWDDLPEHVRSVRLAMHKLAESPKIAAILKEVERVGRPLIEEVDRLEREAADQMQQLGLPWNIAIDLATDAVRN